MIFSISSPPLFRNSLCFHLTCFSFLYIKMIKQEEKLFNKTYSNYENFSDRLLIKKQQPKFLYNIISKNPQDIIALSKIASRIKICYNLNFTFSIALTPDIFFAKLKQLSKRIRSIRLSSHKSYNSSTKMLKKIFKSGIKFFKFQIEEVPLTLIKICSRTIDFLSFSFYYTEFDIYRNKILKIVQILSSGPKDINLPLLIKIDGLRYDAKFINELYLASLRLKRRPLNFFIDLNYQEVCMFEEFDKLGKRARFYLSSSDMEEKALYTKNVSQISNLELGLHHTIEKNFFDLVPYLQKLDSLIILKFHIFTHDAKTAFEKIRFPPNLTNLDFLLHDGNQKDPKFTYTIQELRGNTERKHRACNLIDRTKHYNDFLDQFKTLQKLKNLRFSIISYYEVHHVYVLFFYALAKRLILPLETLALELKKVETQKQNYDLEYADLNLPTVLNFLLPQKNLKAFEFYCPLMTLDGYWASKSILSSQKLSFSPNVLRTAALLNDPIELLEVICKSRLEFVELFRINSKKGMEILGQYGALVCVKYLSMVFEIEDQLKCFEVEDFVVALTSKKRLKVLRMFMLYQKFEAKELERIDKILTGKNSIETSYVQFGANILRKV
jgi:hypothetical protein